MSLNRPNGRDCRKRTQHQKLPYKGPVPVNHCYWLLLIGLLLPTMRTQGLKQSRLLSTNKSSSPRSTVLVRISERVWRQAANDHSARIRELLQPGLTPKHHQLNSGSNRIIRHTIRSAPKDDVMNDWVTALDPAHPIYNFLIEYYGLKGTKGVRRLIRWAPSPGLLLLPQSSTRPHRPDEVMIIDSMEELQSASGLYKYHTVDPKMDRALLTKGGILLEGVTEEDFASTLHLRGAQYLQDRSDEGIVYSPFDFFQSQQSQNDAARSASPFLWYQSILRSTLQADPILHCYGLHEWAMQYQPANAPAPPSARYQKHLPLRVSQEVLNDTVERRGVSCSHIDALRFFAEPALPLNRYGGGPRQPLQRSDQVRLEQPACVHAHMDLLKMTLKLQPFCDAELLQRTLHVALEARRLDVAASPYDATGYGLDVVPIETPEGRAEYKSRQTRLMMEVEPVRRDLLSAYDCLLDLAFDGSILAEGNRYLSRSMSSSASIA